MVVYQILVTFINMKISYYLFIPLSNYLIDVNRYFRGEVPSFMECYVNLWIRMIVHDLYFFLMHWMLHQGALYKFIHKMHHESVITTVFSTQHAHPIEQFFGNSLPYLMSLYSVKSRVHFIDMKIYQYFYYLNTLIGHSGYQFPVDLTHVWPFENQSKYHNFHHWKNSGNYGNLVTFWDDLFGTNLYFTQYCGLIRKEKSKERIPN